ncbi:hypothetical protein CAAN1_20S02080 [[Candida] anglica]|uniref:Major facilitator superfamily (MFS) profile domain-containing protein n=1 Tax=[Candida] anglica TaxID=148631 RepID=A0ABP0EG30_9ASCO
MSVVATPTSTESPTKGKVEVQTEVVSDEDTLFEEGDFSKAYLAKSRILGEAIDELGFGKYQWGLFFVAGFGWFTDNAWPVATGLILSRLNEVDGAHYPPGRAPYLTLAQNLGLFGGALFWSLSADIIGRRWAFVLTFLITGIFSLVAGSSPNFAAIGIFDALWSFGVGGNLPVDSAIFLEALPSNKQWILTVMSIWWAIGQLVTNLISWGLIPNYSCPDTAEVCLKKDNWGWRYFVFTLGALTLVMFAFRYLFHVFESPKFYLAKGNNAKAVEIVHRIAKINGKTSTLTVEQLEEIDDKNLDGVKSVEEGKSGLFAGNQLVQQRLEKYNLSHIKDCFGSRKLAISSGLVIFAWGIIGLAFPLYNAFLPTFLELRGYEGETPSVQRTYRNSLIVSVLGIPGSLIAGVLVESRIGRKGVLFISLVLTGVFLFASTTARTSNANLGWVCGFNFVSNIMFGVLYAYTPEVFPAKVRGTAVGLAASFNRIFGIFAPIIGIYADLSTPAPIYTSGALFLFAAVLVVFFPYEPRGKASY